VTSFEIMNTIRHMNTGLSGNLVLKDEQALSSV